MKENNGLVCTVALCVSTTRPSNWKGPWKSTCSIHQMGHVFTCRSLGYRSENNIYSDWSQGQNAKTQASEIKLPDIFNWTGTLKRRGWICFEALYSTGSIFGSFICMICIHAAILTNVLPFWNANSFVHIWLASGSVNTKGRSIWAMFRSLTLPEASVEVRHLFVVRWVLVRSTPFLWYFIQNRCWILSLELHPKWQPTPYIVHYFWPGLKGLWLKVVHF